jgi:hypothetical protein
MSKFTREPNPWAAFAGIAIPGAGHWIVGDRTRAVAIFALVHLVVLVALLGGAAVTPPVSPEPSFLYGLSQSDPIGNTMRALERTFQSANGLSVWAVKFFGYSRAFDGTFGNTFFTNLLSLAGLLNLLATFYLFDSERLASKELASAVANARKENKR